MYYVFVCTVTFNGGTGNLKNAKFGAIVKRVFCITFTVFLFISEPHHENKALGGDIGRWLLHLLS